MGLLCISPGTITITSPQQAPPWPIKFVVIGLKIRPQICPQKTAFIYKSRPTSRIKRHAKLRKAP